MVRKFEVIMKISQSVPFLYVIFPNYNVVTLKLWCRNIDLMSRQCCGDVKTLFRFSKWPSWMLRHCKCNVATLT